MFFKNFCYILGSPLIFPGYRWKDYYYINYGDQNSDHKYDYEITIHKDIIKIGCGNFVGILQPSMYRILPL